MSTTILVVEDDEDIRDTLIEILADEGHDAVGTEDGEAALAWLRGGGPPSVILLDLMMPRMDGASFRRAQLADATIAEIPVIVLSADAHVAARSAELGADGFLRKPVKLAELLDAVNRFGTR